MNKESDLKTDLTESNLEMGKGNNNDNGLNPIKTNWPLILVI